MSDAVVMIRLHQTDADKLRELTEAERERDGAPIGNQSETVRRLIRRAHQQLKGEQA